MQRETTQEEKDCHTFVVIVDEAVATYIEEQRITDTNEYMIRLLRAEKQRLEVQYRDPNEPGILPSDDVIASTPDTSGYPDMRGHFKYRTSSAG